MSLFKRKKKESKEDKVKASDIVGKELNDTSNEQEKIEEQSNNVDQSEYDEDDATEENNRTVSDYIDEVLDYFTQVDPIKLNMLERGKMKKESFIVEVHKYIKDHITKDKELHDKIYKGFASFIWSYDIIDELIEDPDISDIKCYCWDHVRVKRLGVREDSTVKFRNDKHYSKFIEHVAIKNKISISDQNAAQNFVDKKSSPDAILRFNITTAFINSSGKPVLHIRKIPKQKLTEEQLIEFGFFDKKTSEYLKERARSAGGMLFAGKGGSGKTTCMNYLIDFVPKDNSGLVIQENEEMFSEHPDMAFEHTVQNRGEGKIEYTLGDLARNGLLTDIDYFIIGEIKGGEALYLLNAVYTGAKGWASVHGASATEAMKKLVDYIKYNSDYSQEEALQMLLHLDTVIFMENFSVKEITEVTGYDEKSGNLTYKKIL